MDIFIHLLYFCPPQPRLGAIVCWNAGKVYYVIGDFTTATTDGAIGEFTTATSNGTIRGLKTSCVVVSVSRCVTY